MNALVEHRPSLVGKIAAKYSVEPEKMLATLKATAFKSEKPVSNEQMMALLIVADQYGLNPFTRELFAFPDKQNGIVPVVSVDGWSRILNDHPQFDGLEFEFGPEEHGLPAWCECIIFRKDREHPIRVREFMIEVRRGSGAWQTHPRRMLRHKALIQCARVALGFSGIYDQDEAERIAAAGSVAYDLPPGESRTDQVKQLLAAQPKETSPEEPPPAEMELPMADERAVPPDKEQPMLTLYIILAVAALLTAIASATGRVPLWVSVVLLAIIECLHALPAT